MANEKLRYLIADVNPKEISAHIEGGNLHMWCDRWRDAAYSCLDKAEASKAADMREFAEDVVYQFGYYCQNGGRLHITHGGLSTLEWAFDILGWENPHPVPECECEIDGCHEHATCGAPTADGYKRMCGRHWRERREGE